MPLSMIFGLFCSLDADFHGVVHPKTAQCFRYRMRESLNILGHPPIMTRRTWHGQLLDKKPVCCMNPSRKGPDF
jgi:hypothetical protein